MPARAFDRLKLRAERRSRDLTQKAFAEQLGTTRGAVANWESGVSRPDPEKLPAVASTLGASLERLFPREGAPDLADLRCDAGLTQYAADEAIGRTGIIGAAERGEQRLAQTHTATLAAAYGVTAQRLLDAQERSFGREVPEQETVPVTLAEKITYLLEHTYPGDQRAPTDGEMAQTVNESAGTEIVTEDDIRALRTGERTDPPPGVLEGLAAVFDVSKMFFESDTDVVRQVVEGLRLLASVKSGVLGAIAARGAGDGGLAPDVMAFIRQVAHELQEKEARAKPPKPGSLG
ncbi:helix-turn-helix transcriptional regulator [Streptomyces sp. NPDC048172]|uniref:helix-turn-helix transcriptional regulator n=1 Tax=Streptomyces sp. NPDC048172 TaxID=3365505 RepID=UPI0037230B30